MKKKLLYLFSVVLFSGAVNAQTWTAPEEPTTGSEVISGHQYKMKHVLASEYNQAPLFFAGGTAWYSWSTSSVLNETGIVLQIDQTENGWTFKNTADNKFTFISGATPGGAAENSGEMHVDQGTQAEDLHFFDLMKVGDYYRVFAAKTNTAFNIPVFNDEGEPVLFWGWKISPEFDATAPYAIYSCVTPGNEYACDWEFIDMSRYNALVNLYNKLLESEEYPSVDNSAAAKVYENENSTYEEVLEAYNALSEAVYMAQVYAVLDGASAENPKDATSLLVNPDFSAGNTNGWDLGFTKGENVTNLGYQGASYKNDKYTYLNHNNEEVNPNCDKFIEGWAANGTKFGSYSYSTLGDGYLSQTLKSLPAGKYKFTCDAISVQQYAALDRTGGVQLFAVGGDIDVNKEIITGNGIPEHVELTFVSSGGNVTLGLRTVSAQANWIAADNFELIYYGEVTEDPYKLILDEYIAECEAKYPDMDEVFASQEVKDAYQTALDAAKEATEDFEAAEKTLKEAVSNLAQSVSEYAKAKLQMDAINVKISDAEERGWSDLAGNLGDYRDGLVEAYTEGTLTSEQVAAISEDVNAMIRAYVSENCKAGDDITLLLDNPNFDRNFSGWETKEGTVTPAWGGCKKNPNGDLTDHEELEEYRETGLPGGNAEVYHAAFDIYQTIHNMPRGLYELSCKAFERDENGAVNAELYAVLPNGEEETVKVMEINEDLSPVQIYNYGSETPDGNNSRDMGAGWAPDGMSSANWHFAAGYYKNKFNIIVTESGDFTVGIRTTSKQDWVLFDDFQLVYKGSGNAVFADAINDKIAKLQAELDKTHSNEVDNMAMQTISDAEASLESTDEDAPVNALNALDDAIAAVKASAALVEKLNEEYIAITEYRMNDIDSSEPTFTDLLDEINSAIENGDYENDAQIEGYIVQLKAGFTAYVQYDGLATASEDDSWPMTSVIYNTNAKDPISQETSANGWSENAGLDDTSFEMFNKTYDFNQTIYGLAPGYYRLSVNAFYRNGDYKSVVSALNGETYEEIVPVLDEEGNPVVDEEGKAVNDTITKNYVNEPLAKLYAGSTETNVILINAELDEYNLINPEGAEVTIGGVAMKMPNSMADAGVAFQNDLYKNVLQFKVEEGQSDVKIGIKKSVAKTNDWTIFTNWALEFIGTDSPLKDPTTAIVAVSQNGVASSAIFDLAGRKVSKAVKGVYIINGKKVIK